MKMFITVDVDRRGGYRYPTRYSSLSYSGSLGIFLGLSFPSGHVDENVHEENKVDILIMDMIRVI